MAAATVFTVGTSTRSREDFLELLALYGIRRVVDVRRFPTSQRFPHFNRDVLTASLADMGISYYYLGDKLGGYRPEGYAAFTQSATFQAGLKELLALAVQEPTAIICSERFPWKCHRRFIASCLVARGVKVIHILDRDRTYQHPEPTNEA